MDVSGEAYSFEGADRQFEAIATEAAKLASLIDSMGATMAGEQVDSATLGDVTSLGEKASELADLAKAVRASHESRHRQRRQAHAEAPTASATTGYYERD
jgi:hypothetical protein